MTSPQSNVADFTTGPSASAIPLMERVSELEPLIRALAPEAEIEGRVSQPVVDGLRESGFFRMFVPACLGGLEVDPVTGLQVIEELSRIDSAAGWNVGIGNASALFGAWFPEKVVREVYEADTVFAGAWNPPRTAVPVEGGYRVSGKTLFGSNCHNANWLLGLAHIEDADNAAIAETTFLTLIPMSECQIVQNWDVLGMRGTGSDDIIVDDVLVPSERVTPLGPITDACASFSGPFHRLSSWPAVAAQAPPALGIARAAIEHFVALATEKTPSYTANLLRERSVAQTQVAQAEAKVQAARAYLYTTFDKMWQRAQDGFGLEMEHRAECQLASSNAVTAAAEAVDLVFLASGSASFRNSKPFQRFFRDVHVITQHAFVSASRYESVGQIMLGVEPDWGFFHL
jgi:alkylation response protein AidB-like acyl-CoA dehydrogenase